MVNVSFFAFAILTICIIIYKNMEITWHEEKRQGNLSKHGLDFAQAHKVFAGVTFTFEDNRFDYWKNRCVFSGIGRLYFEEIKWGVATTGQTP